MSGPLKSSPDFFAENGWYIELARVGANSNLGYVLREKGLFKTVRIVETPDYVFVPPKEDEFTRHIRFAETVGVEMEVQHLLTEVDDFLAWCFELDDRRRFLLDCFVLSTWVVDWLPVAPYIALVGLPGSGKSTALRALSLICRRGLVTYDISSAAFYRACDRFGPTLCIDEAATAGEKRALFHLLRSGTTRDAAAFRVGQSYRAYGAKAVSWNEMPDDEALNSRCIIIPMKESLRSPSVRLTDPEVIEHANYLQGLLLRYRLNHFGTPLSRALSGQERLRSRDRDLYEALALPLYGNRKLCAILLECFEQQQNVNREPLYPSQTAVLQGFFRQVHIQPDREHYALSAIKKEVDLFLSSSGERFRLNERRVSEMLKTFGFVDRRRTKTGWVVLVDSAARGRLHELLWLYGIDWLACLPAEPRPEPCEFCKALDHREDDVQGRFPSFDRRGWAYTEGDGDAPGNVAISPPEKRRRAQAAREKFEELRERLDLWNARGDWERSVLDPSEFAVRPAAVETPAEADGTSEPISNGSEDGNGAGLNCPPASVSAQPPRATSKTEGEPASLPEGAGEKPGGGGLVEPGTNAGEHGEHDEHENGAGATGHLPLPQSSCGSDTEQGPRGSEPNSTEPGAGRPGAETRELSDSGLTGRDHERESKPDLSKPDDAGEHPNRDDLDDL